MLPLILTMAFIVLLGGALAGMAMTRPQAPAETRAPAPEARPSRFFLAKSWVDGTHRATEVSEELLLARIEQYMREERAAVESFPERPRKEDLETHNQLTLN